MIEPAGSVHSRAKSVTWHCSEPLGKVHVGVIVVPVIVSGVVEKSIILFEMLSTPRRFGDKTTGGPFASHERKLSVN